MHLAMIMMHKLRKKADSDVPGPDNNSPSVNGTPGEDGAVAAPPASTTSPGRVLQ